VRHEPEAIRLALLRQWALISKALPSIDLNSPSRIQGWTNRELVAHLTLQPTLLRRFLDKASSAKPSITLSQNLLGTKSLAEVIDAATREAAEKGELDFVRGVEQVRQPLMEADLASTVVAIQGPISLTDYLVTRCIEGVVHGRDLVDPVVPDSVAESITADALISVLVNRAPTLVEDAQKLPLPAWIDIATGRQPASGELGAVLPLMT
jgi:Mycothiol maleylpyruvate isomerase N-terminal domain